MMKAVLRLLVVAGNSALLALPLLLLALSLLALLLIDIGYDNRAWDAENTRLLDIVASKYNDLPFPSMGTLIYEEGTASRKCKIAEIRKLFASDMAPTEICRTIYSSLNPNEWASHDGCRVMTYPYRPEEIAPTRPAYEHARLSACIKPFPCMFGIEVAAAPKEAWGSLFMLSRYGENEAIPLARKGGKSFYTVSLHYSEDNTYRLVCPEGRAECECDWNSLSWGRFPDGQNFYRSE